MDNFLWCANTDDVAAFTWDSGQEGCPLPPHRILLPESSLTSVLLFQKHKYREYSLAWKGTQMSAFWCSTLTSKTLKVYIFFYLDVKEENSVWSLGWENNYVVPTKNKQDASADDCGMWEAVMVRFPARVSCSSFRQSITIYLIKSKPWISDKNLVSVLTKVNADMEQEIVLRVRLSCMQSCMYFKSPESKAFTVIVGTWKCVC